MIARADRRIPLLALLLCATALACDPERPAEGPALGAGGFPDPGGGGPIGDCDEDRDGHDTRSCGGDDCDDGNGSVHPGVPELCDGVDSNCDGQVDEGCECEAGDLSSCWEGSVETRGVGACRDGHRRCLPSGTWGPCTDAVLPETEAAGCDGVDSDCDGTADDDPACAGCPAGAPEICGNGLDDDCSGTIDDAAICTVSCAGVNPRDDPGVLGCCLRSPPSAHAFTCVEYPGLAPCADRECLDLDGDLDTRCSKLCDGSGCRCGRRDGTGDLTAVVDCGFLTPCARVDCDLRQDQPCYSGPPRTLGVGLCRAGRHSCVRGDDGALAWNACEGEQVPGPEVCGNGLDEDCDGLADEEDGATGMRCELRAACPEGALELCGNGLDDDCDGFADEACPAPAGESQACWTGTLAARGIGACKDGRQSEVDGAWGPCRGEVLPGPEICDDAIDGDCDRLGGPGDPEEPACCVPGPEVCNGLDDDCDGVADEGLVNRCGQCPGGGSCHGIAVDDLSRCDEPGRTCTRIEPFAGDRGLVTLSPGARAQGGDVLYATEWSFSSQALLQVDPETGDVLWTQSLGSGFTSGITTAVDGSVWLFRSSFPTSQLEHRARADGSLLCRAEVTTLSSIAADPGGDVWTAVTVDGKARVRRYSGSEVLLEESPGVPWPDGLPRCAVVDVNPDATSTDFTVTSSGALVLDPGARIWSLGFSGFVIDLLDGSQERLDASIFAWGEADLGVDGGIYLTSPLRRLDIAGPSSGAPVSEYLRTYSGFSSVIDAAPAPDGTIFALETDFWTRTNILLVDPQTGEKLRTWPLPEGGGSFAVAGLAVDGAGRLWTGQGRQLERLDPGSGTWEVFERQSSIQVASGSTNVAVLDLQRRSGRWSQVIDPGAFDVQWDELSWRSLAPPGTRAVVAARFADDLEGLDTSSAVCGPYEQSPADISHCSRGRRYARVEIFLSGFGKPVAGDLRLTWDRP